MHKGSKRALKRHLEDAHVCFRLLPTRARPPVETHLRKMDDYPPASAPKDQAFKNRVSKHALKHKGTAAGGSCGALADCGVF